MTLQTLRGHARSHHRVSLNIKQLRGVMCEQILCQFCGRAFTRTQTMKEHIRKLHSQGSDKKPGPSPASLLPAESSAPSPAPSPQFLTTPDPAPSTVASSPFLCPAAPTERQPATFPALHLLDQPLDLGEIMSEEELNKVYDILSTAN